VYLSQLQLNPRSKQARTDLANPYQLHATLCRAFVPEDQPPPRFLWRLEESKTPQVLVQSANLPHWEILTQRFPGYFAEAPQSRPIPLDHLQPAQILRFRLKANPTVTKRDPADPEGKKRKRHGLKEVEEQLQWLQRQGQKSGFTVLGAMVAGSERVKIYKHDGGSPIVIQSALYEGHLKITELETFKQTLATGLGHAKALGFGLLSIGKG
jgi:CRISPR system Cascade subunit CasE